MSFAFFINLSSDRYNAISLKVAITFIFVKEWELFDLLKSNLIAVKHTSKWNNKYDHI